MTLAQLILMNNGCNQRNARLEPRKESLGDHRKHFSRERSDAKWLIPPPEKIIISQMTFFLNTDKKMTILQESFVFWEQE